MSNLAARALSSFVNTLFVIQCWQCNVNWAARELCISQSPPKAQHEQQKKANESDNRREDWEYQFARHLFHYTAHSISPAIDGIIFYISHIYSYRSARQTNQCIGLKLICFSLLYNDFFFIWPRILYESTADWWKSSKMHPIAAITHAIIGGLQGRFDINVG